MQLQFTRFHYLTVINYRNVPDSFIVFAIDGLLGVSHYWLLSSVVFFMCVNFSRVHT